MEELIKKNDVSLYEDSIEGEDGSIKKFLIIGIGGRESSIRRDAKGNLLYGKSQKILFTEFKHLNDLKDAFTELSKNYQQK